MIKKSLLLLSSLTCSIILTNCVSVLPPKPKKSKTITFKAIDIVGTSAKKTDWDLIIDIPQAPSYLDNDRIAFKNLTLTGIIEQGYFAQVQWPTDLPKLLQHNITRAFNKTNLFKSVSRAAELTRGSRILKIDILEFQVDYQKFKAPKAHISFVVKLLKKPGLKIITAKTFTTSRIVQKDQLTFTIKAFQKGLSQITQEILNWLTTK